MPPFSKNLAEEGVLIRNFKLVDGGRSRLDELRALLLSGPYPTRTVDDNLADIAAQVAANHQGARDLAALVERYTLPVVEAYMGHIQRAAERKMRAALARLPDGACTLRRPSGRRLADRRGRRPSTASRPIDRLHRHRAGRRRQPERQSGHRHGGRDVLPALPDRRRHPAEPGRAGAGRDRAARVPAQSAASAIARPSVAAVVGGNVETSQRVVDVLLGAWASPPPARGR